MSGATPLQRLGEFVAIVEAAGFGLAAVLHGGTGFAIHGVALSAPVVVSATIIEGVIALGLLLSVIAPGRGAPRAGRVVAAQVLAVLGVLVGQVALTYSDAPRSRVIDLLHVGLLALAFVSMLLIAWPHVPRSARQEMP